MRRYTDGAKLFTIRMRLSSGWVTMTAWEGGFQQPNHTRLDCELRQGGRVIFARGDTWCALAGQHTIDGDDAKELVCSLFSMKEGDTDDEFFADYTPEQLEWTSDNGEELSMLKEDRYGPR